MFSCFQKLLLFLKEGMSLLFLPAAFLFCTNYLNIIVCPKERVPYDPLINSCLGTAAGNAYQIYYTCKNNWFARKTFLKFNYYSDRPLYFIMCTFNKNVLTYSRNIYNSNSPPPFTYLLLILVNYTLPKELLNVEKAKTLS